MKKGKVSNKHKQSRNKKSIISIPHSTNKLSYKKTLNINLNEIIKVIVILTLLVGMAYQFMNTNQLLQEREELLVYQNQLENIVDTQNELIDENIKTLSDYSEQKRVIEEYAKDVKAQYIDIIETYINQNTTIATISRAEVNNQVSFIENVEQMKSLQEYLDVLINKDSEMVDELELSREKLRRFLNSIPTAKPVIGNISSPYGMRMHPVIGVNKFHTGIDFTANYGNDIVATAWGQIIYSGWQEGYGYCVIIQHSNDIKTLYAHSSKLLVKKGDIVEKGDTIAKVGDSGTATGTHLHYEIMIKDQRIDPMKYLIIE